MENKWIVLRETLSNSLCKKITNETQDLPVSSHAHEAREPWEPWHILKDVEVMSPAIPLNIRTGAARDMSSGGDSPARRIYQHFLWRSVSLSGEIIRPVFE